MKFIELYNLLNEGLKDLSYAVPKDKYHQLVDFYLATYPYRIDQSDPKAYLLFTSSGESVEKALEEAKKKIVDHLHQDILDAVFFAIGCEIRHITTSYRNRPATSKSELMKEFIQALPVNATREQSNEILNKIYKDNRIQAVEDCKDIFLRKNWKPKFGGKPWADICDAWMQLYNARSLGNKIVGIDHIIDIQHNTGSVFNKVQSYYKDSDLGWLKRFLDFKSKVSSAWDLYSQGSSDMKAIVAPLMKMSGYGTVDTARYRIQSTEKQKLIGDIDAKPALLQHIDDKEIQSIIISRIPSAIQWVKNPDKELQLTAVKKSGSAIQFINNPDKDVQLAAVKQDVNAIKYINNPDKDVQLDAVKQNGWAIKYINNPDKDVQLAAVKEDGFAIRYINNPDKDVQLAAVKQDGYAIHFINNPDKDVQLDAVKQNGWAIKYIKNPDPEVIKASKQ